MDTFAATLVAAFRWLAELVRGWQLDLAARRGEDLDHE